ncbi:RsmB/NOP family class I SAM-dependent RNA methyltransferase [Allosphingosinicella indica]|uniref:16S rRNA (Cytosine967-C5)-methyltransferase n=1 Tax=Allosphingosinicella indica TaxID=941907 RepID=A0A1X7H3I3_9SPHN|nr:RsmB/NOP family class I SAM-dependent RNA methyltransferase [Allosphingosinicella indica]SMF78999.1 16S rRNA (cytosine967-C5)-methyltransferase [Allosphingosinicella indica]
MTPAARAQAAIELLDQIITAARTEGAAADTLIARYFKTRRYAGSKDRRAVRDIVYRAIRRSGEVPASGRAALLGLAGEDPALPALFDGSPHGPTQIEAGDEAAAASAAPKWLLPRFDPLLDDAEIAALLDRAPLDVRVNRLRATRDALDITGAEPTPLSPIGLRLPEGTQVEASDAWTAGQIEVQDEGSQLVSIACGAAPGMTVVDLCAGAGGKSLALAAEMDNSGRIIACDTDRGRLSRLPERAVRGGITIAETRLLDPRREAEALADIAGAADVVLIDAPCSGTGTWRRNPEARWRLTPERLERLTLLQARLLDLGAGLVRPGGALVYVTCSLLAEEGRGQADAFTRRRSSFVSELPPISWGRPAGSGRLLTPAHDRTDGFFVARWRAPC